MKRILIAGIGNIFFGDDAFGVEVAQALLRRRLPPQVQVIDFGIRSYDLAFALTDDYDAIILVDATPRGGRPGELYWILPDLNLLGPPEGAGVDAHSLDPVRVLQMAESFGGVRGQLYLIGCEPALLEPSDGELGLSRPVGEAVPKAVEMIEAKVANFLSQETENRSGFAPAERS